MSKWQLTIVFVFIVSLHVAAGFHHKLGKSSPLSSQSIIYLGEHMDSLKVKANVKLSPATLQVRILTSKYTGTIYHSKLCKKLVIPLNLFVYMQYSSLTVWGIIPLLSSEHSPGMSEDDWQIPFQHQHWVSLCYRFSHSGWLLQMTAQLFCKENLKQTGWV